MDSLDLEILVLIQNDARLAHASVGEKLGLTAPAVHARIKRLERDGVIRGYLTSINPLAVNQTLLAFARVMNSASGKDEEAFERFVVEEPSILECHDISGEDSYMLKIRTDSPASLRRLLSRIREFPGVERTVTSISLCTIKESGGPPLPARRPPAGGDRPPARHRPDRPDLPVAARAARRRRAAAFGARPVDRRIGRLPGFPCCRKDLHLALRTL